MAFNQENRACGLLPVVLQLHNHDLFVCWTVNISMNACRQICLLVRFRKLGTVWRSSEEVIASVSKFLEYLEKEVLLHFMPTN